MHRINRKITGFLAAFFFLALFSATSLADPAFSEYWIQDASGAWHITDGNGNTVKNAWLCDDAVASNGQNVWYLIDGSGNMISAGLVQDGTGNYYSLEQNHEGYYGMLRYQSGVYTADGLTVSLELESNHNGSFASIKNTEGIEKLKNRYGVTKVSIDNGNCVYTSSFTKTSGNFQTVQQETAKNEAEETSGTQFSSASAVSGNTLTAADFSVTGASVPSADMKIYLSDLYSHDGAVYFYYDSSSDSSRAGVVRTARGITLASSKADVIAAYGAGTAVNVSNPADTKAIRIVYAHDPNGVSEFLRSCLCYTTEDGGYSVYFGFKDSGQVSFIIYYVV